MKEWNWKKSIQTLGQALSWSRVSVPIVLYTAIPFLRWFFLLFGGGMEEFNKGDVFVTCCEWKWNLWSAVEDSSICKTKFDKAYAVSLLWIQQT